MGAPRTTEPREEGRRPIAARKAGWARAAARFLAGVGVTPNQVSVFSVLATAGGAASLVLSRDAEGAARVTLLLVAAATIPLRAACNMFDGMIAVEHGRATKSGIIFNELPDRVSDVLMLIGAGYAIDAFEGAEALGWLAAILAVLTAYVRSLAASAGAGHDFSGVMAKQQRMAVMTVSCLVSTLEPLWDGDGEVLFAALVIVSAGSALTVLQRTWSAIRRLEGT